MTWQPRPLATLPLVLAGPLLRRVDGNTVTVWLALREPRKVTLRVYAGDADGAGADQLYVGSRNTVRLSANCHLVAVTATGPAPLAAGTTYRYDVFFGAPGDEAVPVPATEPRLYGPDIVAATPAAAQAALTYPGGPTLPSFATPPADLNRLRVIHSSCRKPHGAGEDALAVLDDILRADVADPLARPQQLVLTGSQIYADDVADAHLAVLRGIATTLGATVETLPGVPAAEPRLRPGRRQELVTAAGLTVPAGKSHLFSLAEFWAMYLTVWSDVLWPAQLPEFGDVHPEDDALLSRKPADMRLSDAWETLTGYGAASARRDAFLDERKALTAFRDGLGGIRRVLANVPTYLVLGEHEVSEDWYATQRWTEQALADGGGGLGRRVVQNALTAYALCQAWGNTPERFAAAGAAGEPGRRLLAAVAGWTGTEDATSATIRDLVGLPTTIVNGVPQRPAGALGWHYHLRWAAHQLIVLDTRTTRVYLGGPDDPPALLWGDAAFKDQIGDPPDLGPEAATFVASATPVAGYPFVSDFVQRMLGTRYRGRGGVDTEAWGLQRAAYEKLISRLFTRAVPADDGTRRQRIILLSGEVGYGFAARLRYDGAAPFRALAPGPTRGVIAQFVSSAAKNEDGLTRFLHGTGFDITADRLPRSRRYGWANPGGGQLTVGTEIVDRYTGGVATVPWTVTGTPAVAEVESLRRITRTQDWSYEVTFVKHDAADPTIPPRPGTPRPVYPPTGNRSSALGQYLAAAENHDDYLGKWGDGKEVVGYANLGEVTLSWAEGDAKKAVQTLWWRLGGTGAAAPLTRCVVDLSTRATGPQRNPDHLVLILEAAGAEGSAGSDRRAEDTWVYWREGSTTRRLRGGTDGYLYASSAADSADPWDYTQPFKPATGTVAQVAYSTGARPLPDALLTTANLFQPRTVPAVPPVDAEQPRSLALPARLLRLVTPTELALWPVLWQLPDTYLTAGLNQGAAAWANPAGAGALTVAEGAVAAVAPAADRPRERGLRVEGEVDGAATEVRVRLRSAAGVDLPLRTGIAADAPQTAELTAQLGPVTAGVRTFSVTVFLAAAVDAFGPVEIVVTATGPAVPHVESFTVHLCGGQLALVDDPQPATRGPQLGVADERVVVDFRRSPQATTAALSAETRVRRMVRYQIRNQQRPAPAGGNLLMPQMPMWMGEVQFVGLSADQLRDLLRRRYARKAVLDPPDPEVNPPRPVQLRIDWDWRLELGWDGPDSNSGAFPAPMPRPLVSHLYQLPAVGTPVAVLHYGAQGQFTDRTGRDLVVDADGRLPGVFDPAPSQVPFPVADRRLPAVVVSGQNRPWGRAAGAATRPALVLEFQPTVTEADATVPGGRREIIRGGDGLLRVSAFRIDQQPFDVGVVAAADGTLGPPPGDTPLLRLPDFRVIGQDPAPDADIEAVILALVDEYYDGHLAVDSVNILSRACWRWTVLEIFSHESGIRGGYSQFDTRGAGRRRWTRQGGEWLYGTENDMPLFGPPHGYGVGQLDDIFARGANADEVWNWRENIRSGVRLLMEEKAGVVYNIMRNHLPNPVDRRSRAVFQREVVRRYNGGGEFRREGGDWVIRPRLQYATPGDPASGPHPNLRYPNAILPQVIYYTNAAGAAHVAAGAATVYPWPIAFTADLYGPETA
ncbi:hypothetical protein [Micromonospora sp. NPDC051296]|uniref:hypothetical protein n=1 Tax=Micromonospora sp. NPDC051296 TaxID=3155046 RepID=UPI0034217695